ncbi:MAG TPA: hypothetical protein VGW31_12180 [Hanamia sp.]|nr:hypothetical protein [Hanamia sp.]
MAVTGGNTSLKRLKNHYRLVVMNEDTFEEVVAFKMNRWSVYVTLSALFVILVGLTISLIAFTPLKFYIPGYGEAGRAQEYEALKVRADSIEHTLILKQKYISDIEKVLKGNVIALDTSLIEVVNIDKIPVETRKKKRK